MQNCLQSWFPCAFMKEWLMDKYIRQIDAVYVQRILVGRG